MKTIKEGKLSTDQLKKLIFRHTDSFRDEVLSHPYIGQDCAFLDSKNKIITISSDPITAASENIGELAVIININDIAASGADPFAITVTLLFPVGTAENHIDSLMKEISSAAKSYNVQIIGGHTEVTSSVNKTVISVTALGMLDKDYYDSLKKPSGDYNIYMTKTAAIEGTYIIANEMKNDMKKILNDEDRKIIQEYSKSIAVVDDARIARKYFPVMHDITEGGVLGAVHEMCELFDMGAVIHDDKIPVAAVTKKICDHYDIDPLRLISSGSMLIFADSIHNDEILSDFEKSGIDISHIGRITEEKKVVLIKNGEEEDVIPPSSDEIYKVI